MTTLGSGLSSILRNAAYLLGSDWLASALRLAYTILLARALGPDGYGLIASGQALYLLFGGLVSSGLDLFLARELAKSRADGEQVVRLSLFLRTIALIVVAAVFVIMAVPPETDPTGRAVLAVFVVALLARGHAVWARQVFIAYEATGFNLRLIAVFRTAEVVVAAIAILLGAGPVTVAVIHSASWLAEAIASLWAVHRSILPLNRRLFVLRGFKTAAMGILSIGLVVASGQWLRLGPLALYKYVAANPEQVGQFALAWNATVILSMMVTTVMRASVPVVGRATARRDDKDVYYLDFAIRFGVMLGTLLVIAAIGAGPWIIELAFGSAYAGAGAMLAATLSVVGPVVMSFAIDQILTLRHRTGSSLLVAAVSAGIGTLVFVHAATHYSPAVAALSVLGIFVAMILAKMVLLNVALGIALFEPFARACLAAGLALVVLYSMLDLGAGAALACVAATIAWIVLPFVTGAVTPAERQSLGSVLGLLANRYRRS